MVYRFVMIVVCSACRARFSIAEVQVPPEGRTVRCSRCRHEWHVEKQGAQEVLPPAPTPQAPPAAIEATPPAAVENFTPAADETANNEPLFVEQVQTTEPEKVEDLDPEFLAQLDAVIAQSEANAGKPAKAAKAAKVKTARTPIPVKPFKLAVPALAVLWLVVAFVAYFPSWAELPGLSGIYHALGAKPTDGLVFSDVAMERAQEGSKTKYILSGSIQNHSNMARVVPTVRVLLQDKNGKTIIKRAYPVNAELKAGDTYPFRIANIETAFSASITNIVVDLGNSFQLMVR